MTLGIIAANVLVYLLVNVAHVADSNFANIAFGHVPSVAHEFKNLPPKFQVIPDYLYGITAITAAFLHANFMHLGGNMLFIWVFGDNVEDAMGHVRFFIFYLLCAYAASWFHAFSFPESDAPLIGASGAAAGLVSAYLMLHPRMKIWVLFLGRFPLRLPAFALLGLWIAFQGVMYITDSGSNVSWAAHVGGIIAGIVLVGLFKRREVHLFDREVVLPGAIELQPKTILPPQIKPSPPPAPPRSKWGRKAKDRSE
ncbi:MAG: rhomboid family intramembrane serine protease [Rhizobiaceae bacterium]